MKYTKPEVEVVELEVTDVITASIDEENPGGGLIDGGHGGQTPEV